MRFKYFFMPDFFTGYNFTSLKKQIPETFWGTANYRHNKLIILYPNSYVKNETKAGKKFGELELYYFYHGFFQFTDQFLNLPDQGPKTEISL